MGTDGEPKLTAVPQITRRPRRRRSRCSRPRHVRNELLRVTHALWNNELDVNKANALVNAYRVILSTITGATMDERVATLEVAIKQAVEGDPKAAESFR